MFSYLTGFILPVLVMLAGVLYFGWWFLLVPVILAVGVISAVIAWHWQHKRHEVKKLERQFKL